MSKLSYGLNIAKKAPSKSLRPPPAKRKPIFDDDDDDNSGPEDELLTEENAESIQTIGGLKSRPEKGSPGLDSKLPNSRAPPSEPNKISQYGDLATKHSALKHSKGAQEIDPSVYEYDEVYDSLHVKPKSNLSSASGPDDGSKQTKPKYMAQLLAASEVRKRDQVRAKEKMLAREREAEGDEFADKEKFVTAAYKRQQEEMRKAEEEEAEREKQAEERRKREGGGMKSLYKSMLEKDEERHQQTMKQMKAMKNSGNVKSSDPVEYGTKKEKSEADLAREKGAIFNEEGEVVDKRQLLNAGLNAASESKPPRLNTSTSGSQTSNTPRKPRGQSRNRGNLSTRESDTRAFEQQILGKRSVESDDDAGDAARAAKSKKMEDEILAMIGK